MKRLNVKLAVWLVAIGLFSLVGVHFLHAYQVGRNAEYLKVQAEAAHKRGDTKESISLYNQYLKHRDDPQAYSVLSEMLLEYATAPDATRKTRYLAYTNLSEAVRRHGELNDVRRRLIDLTMQIGVWAEALEQIKYLNEQGEKGTDLDLKMVRCYIATREEDKALKKLYELVGYDEATATFVPEKATAPHEVEAFEYLQALLLRKNEPKLASEVLAQAVAMNPDSARAHLARARHLLISAERIQADTEEHKQARAETEREGKTELDRALELGPDDGDVIILAALYATMKKDFAKAEQLLERARKEHGDRQDIYLQLAELKRLEGHQDQAVEQLKLGLTKASDTQQILEKLVDFQLQLNDVAGAGQPASR